MGPLPLNAHAEGIELVAIQVAEIAGVEAAAAQAGGPFVSAARSDGRVSRLVYNPYTLQPKEFSGKYEIKWLYR